MAHNISTLIHDVKSISISRYAVQRSDPYEGQRKEFFVTAVNFTLDDGQLFEIRAFETEEEMTFLTSTEGLPIAWDK